MTWKTELSKDLTALQVLCSGKLSPDDLTMLAIETSFLAQEHGCRRILIDLAEANLDFPASQLCELLDTYAEYQLKQTARTGIVFGPKSRPLEFAQVLATAKAYGYQMDVVTENQAKAWLLQTD